MAQTRKVRLQSDLETVKQFCASSQLCKVLECTDESLELLFIDHQSKTEKSYTIHYMTDYPDGTALCCESDNVFDVLSQPLPAIFSSIFTEFCQKHNLPLPDKIPSSCDALDRQASDCSYVTASDIDVMSDQYEEEDEDDEDMREMSTPHPLLDTDLTRVAEKFGQLAVDYKMYPTIDEIDIYLNIDVQCILDEDTASAWGVNLVEPIVVFVRFKCMSLYLDGVEPEIKVYQPSNKDNFCLGIQIKKILETFVASQLKELSCQCVEEFIKDTHKGGEERDDHNNSSQIVTDEAIAKVMTLGFDHQQAVDAIIKAKGDVGQASIMLSCNQQGDDELLMESQQKTPNLFLRQTSSGAQAQFGDNEENSKKIPSLANGFLCQLMEYILQRIKTLNEFCVICDERHIFECSLLKPCVCSRTLCVFSFQTLGVMADAAEAIATDSDVVDLLIAMANAAVCSSRNSIIFDPYPSIVDPHNPQFLALDPSNKQFDLVKKILRVIIDCRRATIEGKSQTKTEMDRLNPCAFPLMQWILASNRSHIVLLPSEKRIASMKTNYQFLLVSSPPAKEHAFQKAKSSHGSTYAFHGSSIENWHSIVRKGLLNASGTKFQMNGAAHGKGIYLSPLSSVSFGYTRGYYGKVQSNKEIKGLAGQTNLTCMALCEVINQNIKKNGDIWVCPQEDHVCTRFFFVYDESHGNSINVDTRRSDTQKEIDHAISIRRMIKATT